MWLYLFICNSFAVCAHAVEKNNKKQNKYVMDYFILHVATNNGSIKNLYLFKDGGKKQSITSVALKW